MEYKIGEVVIANKLITAGLGSAHVFAEEGEHLLYEGRSTNGLHPHSVSKMGNRFNAFAVSDHEIRKAN